MEMPNKKMSKVWKIKPWEILNIFYEKQAKDSVFLTVRV